MYGKAQDWLWPIQASATQPNARPAWPEGSRSKEPMLRCAPLQGRAIGFGTRLALAPWGGSDGMLFCGMGH